MVRKTIGDVKSAISTLQVLNYSANVMVEFVFEHEELFVDEFIKNDIIAITKLSFDGENVHFVYVADSGSHISDSRDMETFTAWVIKVFKET